MVPRSRTVLKHIHYYVSWVSFSYKLVKMLSVCLNVNSGGTNRNHCKQRLVILHAQTFTNESWSYARNQVNLTYFTGQNRQRRKLGMNKAFSARWLSQPTVRLFRVLCGLSEIKLLTSEIASVSHQQARQQRSYKCPTPAPHRIRNPPRSRLVGEARLLAT